MVKVVHFHNSFDDSNGAITMDDLLFEVNDNRNEDWICYNENDSLRDIIEWYDDFIDRWIVIDET